METNKIYQGDCLEVMKTFPDNSVDSIVTDPPYELGFMGKSWDNTGIANNKEMWKECLRVLKPGGHLLSFGGTRTYHRMASAIEDAGFEVRDMIEWVYGSGFPKSLNIGKAVDKLQGNEREYIGENPNAIGRKENVGKFQPVENISGGEPRKSELTKGTSEWEGWGTALKPAHEPICMARKPLSEKTVAQNVLKYGTGGINIDESRVGTNGEKMHETTYPAGRALDVGGSKRNTPEIKIIPSELGRFPANIIHDNSEEVRECFPETKGDNRTEKSTYDKGIWGNAKPVISNALYSDNGNASRYFKSIIYQAKASKSERNNGMDSFINIEVFNMKCENKQEEKSLIQGERLARLSVDMGTLQIKDIEESGIQKKEDLGWNTILFGKEIMEKYQQDFQSIIKMKTNSTILLKTWNWLMHLLTKEYTLDVNSLMEDGGNLVENVDKSRELIITMNEKLELALGVKNVVSGMQLKIKLSEGKCSHPTVKPVKLMEYLIKMVTPKGGIVLDPFAGSGTTGVACKNLNRNYILIEKEPEYVKIAEERLTKLNDGNMAFLPKL